MAGYSRGSILWFNQSVIPTRDGGGCGESDAVRCVLAAHYFFVALILLTTFGMLFCDLRIGYKQP